MKREVLLTRRALAALLKVHMQTVTKWEREGMPVSERGSKGRPSMYREVDVRAWLAARAQAAKNGTGLDLAQERARKEHWQALLAEQTHRVRARELLPAAEVEKAWSAERDAIRTKILATYTTHTDRVHRAAVIDGLAGVERALKDIAYDVLRELAGGAELQRPRASKRRRRVA